MIDVYKLNVALAGSMALSLNEGSILVSNDTDLDDTQGLTTSQRCDLDTLKHNIAELMPDDFGYTMFLDGREVSFQLEYQDGMVASSGSFLEFSTTEELQGLLVNADWDAMRSDALRGIAQMNKLIAAKKRKGRRK
ncbi:hypothetical protein [Cerasicoccus fimbriatus]|uniref:hypothetical protein n=1 Tax=Cerasicoccus fimbriatus TaxID=3014554 RepID=UPI0022B2ED84|nr:hypothetical protein [Cerasicoccus sp. TK19100]